MSAATTLLAAVHALVPLCMAPLLLGVIGKTKAFFGGRNGPPVLQLYYDLAKLFQKDIVRSRTTSWLFIAGPIVGLSTALVAMLLVPLGSDAAPISFAGDFVLLAYLFGLSRFFTVSAALDTGSAFEGMGAAREATFATLSEPALLLGLLVLVRRSGTMSLSSMLGPALLGEWRGAGASLVLVVVSLFIVLLAENCRIPVDDPNTHLELTMIHEVMVLDHSGPPLGMILYSASLKLFALGAIVVRIALPITTGGPWGDLALFIASMVGLGVVVGVVESSMSRLRMIQVPSLLVAACILSGFGIVLAR